MCLSASMNITMMMMMIYRNLKKSFPDTYQDYSVKPDSKFFHDNRRQGWQASTNDKCYPYTGKARAIDDRGKSAEKPSTRVDGSKTSATVPDSLPDRRGTYRRLPDSLRRCLDSLPDRLGTCKRLLDRDPDTLFDGANSQTVPDVSKTIKEPSGESLTVCDGAKTVWAPEGYLKMVIDVSNTVSAPAGDFQTVFGDARQSLRPVGEL
ncbi:hypothetical protein DPMN_029231 [Dreissena polymorpha]|uniref:Uncharacterized protein n=1 Tax=Dreissena polymorpha TaxID=45954 RepID=A0A9D4RFA3_DREPO|nr:hypothetical protein DPMN_029231 [Dreissena polymorpha]